VLSVHPYPCCDPTSSVFSRNSCAVPLFDIAIAMVTPHAREHRMSVLFSLFFLFSLRVPTVFCLSGVWQSTRSFCSRLNHFSPGDGVFFPTWSMANFYLRFSPAILMAAGAFPLPLHHAKTKVPVEGVGLHYFL